MNDLAVYILLMLVSYIAGLLTMVAARLGRIADNTDWLRLRIWEGGSRADPS